MDNVKTGLGTTIRRMDFRNPIFNNGLNCTVRFGMKWANLQIGEKLIFTSGQSAIVERIIITRFKDITTQEIAYEHDLKCRNKKDLKNCLYGIYPEMVIQKENSIMTIVYFHLI